ncbi:hypothetical protein EVJ58_g10630 [Rhodofomes roseus]|uniref:Uncharacterized protein n=1 Tax=Rhodofomes roseus TaxID=34475 RepID=A0A4Y9XNJ7_9APHY|nr:hypothetical protein EVJ58_g10630 [Rhodofomes roseus]
MQGNSWLVKKPFNGSTWKHFSDIVQYPEYPDVSDKNSFLEKCEEAAAKATHAAMVKYDIGLRKGWAYEEIEDMNHIMFDNDLANAILWDWSGARNIEHSDGPTLTNLRDQAEDKVHHALLVYCDYPVYHAGGTDSASEASDPDAAMRPLTPPDGVGFY